MPGEFEFIQNLKDRYGLSRVGDDCAVLPKDADTDQLITADLLVEDIDFRLDWITPELLGQKALAVSLSDIAAMGGVPRWAMTTVGVPRYVWESLFLDRFYDGWGKLAARFNVELIGGDVSRTPGKIVIDSIVGGELPKGTAVLRSGANPGDFIFVTGTLGGAAGGLMLLESGIRYKDVDQQRKQLITRQIRPTPRIETGIALRERNFASAMIDISDGLSADLYHICDASGVGALLELDKIPSDPNLKSISIRERMIVGGGEDFELLFTVPAEKISLLPEGDFSLIGKVTANAGIVEVTGPAGLGYLPRQGYRHF